MAETPLERSRDGSRGATAFALLKDAIISTEVALVAIVILGALLRFHGLGWDQAPGAQFPAQMHPDERFLSIVNSGLDWPGSIGEYFDTDTSPLNPYNAQGINHYVYGDFPLFLVKASATLAGGDSYSETAVWGRRVTASIDTLTILLVFAVGAMLFTSRIGLFAALAYAVAVFPTQLAHFFTMDPYVTFFAAATMLASIGAIRTRSTSGFIAWGLLAGLALGLGLASKVTAWPLGLMPLLALATRVGLRDFGGMSFANASPGGDEGATRAPRSDPGYWASDIAWFCGVLIVGAVVFRVAMPYAFATPDFSSSPGVLFGLSSIFELDEQWKDEMLAERDFQTGTTDYPPFVQFADNIAFLTPLKNIVLWGLGPGLALSGIAGAIVAAVLMFRRGDLRPLLPLALLIAVFGWQGMQFVAFMRYFVPIYPVLCLFAAWALVGFWNNAGNPEVLACIGERSKRISQRLPALTPLRARIVAGTIIGLVAVSTAWWALAFQNVYAAEHPRLQASEWIYENIPPGSTITHEEWDDSIPYNLPAGSASDYTFIPLGMYHTDSVQKIEDLVYGRRDKEAPDGLADADYVAITSNRVRGSTAKLEREYPATIRYYELLESGELGFDLVAHFKVEPSFLGLAIDDSGAEEAFTVYDHPEVWIYRKGSEFEADRVFALLAEAHPERAINLQPAQGPSNGLQLTAAQAEKQQNGGTFSDVFAIDGFTSTVPWLWWYLWLQVLAFATVPWVAWLFRALPDRGYGLTKVIGFAGSGVFAWMLVAWNILDFSIAVAWFVATVMVAFGAAVAWFRRDDLRQHARDHWRTWLTVEAIFAIAFAALTLMRAFNPDIWHHPQGGEKPMELAYMTAVARSTELPPFDPWFGGGSLNYYYMGWWLLAVPMRALKLVPEIAFNLGIATYGSLAATVAASTVMNLVGLSTTSRRVQDAGRNFLPWPVIAVVAVLGAVFLVGIGNLDAGHQTIERLQFVNDWGAFHDVPVLGGAVGVVGGLWNWLVQGADLPRYDWWRSSRVHFGQFDITEFPFWSLLFADLHPHLMDIPIFGLVIACAVAYIATAAKSLRAQAVVLAAGLGLLAGMVRAMHTWDFPTAVLLAAAAVTVGQYLAAGTGRRRFWTFALHGTLAAMFLVGPWAPFASHFEVFESGIHRAEQTTQPQQYFAHFGLFVVLGLIFLAVRYREELRARNGLPGRNIGLMCVAGPWELLSFAAFVAGLMAFTWQFGVTVVAVSILIILLLANLLWLELRSTRPDLGRLLATGCFLAAFGIAAGVDVVTVNNDIVRMNTVFKFSLQAWQFFALGGAYAAWYTCSRAWGFRDWRPVMISSRPVFAATATGAVAVLLVAGLIFPWSGTRSRQDARFGDTSLTLNGFAFFEHGTYREDRGTPDPADDVEFALADDQPIVEWLRRNVEGSPVVAEAVGGLYHWTGRISMLTGLPAVIGWDWHQVQQRWDYQRYIQERRSDTQVFYQTSDVAFTIDYLRKYNVRYVVVGTEEVALGTPEGLTKFTTMDALTQVYSDGRYAIYEVAADRLPPLTVSR